MDLTEKSREEIKEVMAQYNGNLCARIFEDQLDIPPKRGGMSLKMAVSSLAALLTIGITRVSASENEKVPVEYFDTPVAETEKLKVEPVEEEITVNAEEVEMTIGQGAQSVKSNMYYLFRIGRIVVGTRRRFPFIYIRRYVPVRRHAGAVIWL